MENNANDRNRMDSAEGVTGGRSLQESPDPRYGMQIFLLLDGGVRVLIWAGSLAGTLVLGHRLGLWPEEPFPGNDGAGGLRWAGAAAGGVVVYNLIYLALLIALRLPIPTPREGRYVLIPGRRPPAPILWSCLLATLTKAFLAAPFPAFLLEQLSNLPPMCWVMGRIFGPHSRSVFATQPLVLDPFLVTIGRNVILGHNAVVAAHHVERDAVVIRRTVIEDDVIVGGGAKILGGVHLQRGAVIGAGSVVLPGTVVGPNEYWWGVPARKFRTLPPLP